MVQVEKKGAESDLGVVVKVGLETAVEVKVWVAWVVVARVTAAWAVEGRVLVVARATVAGLVVWKVV